MTAESKHIAKAGLKLKLSKFISINPNNSTAVPFDTIKPAPSSSTTDTITPVTTTGNPVQIEGGTS
jgi:hypothetical protein